MYLGILPDSWVQQYRNMGAILPTEQLYVQLDSRGQARYEKEEMVLVTFTVQTFNQFKRSGDYQGLVSDWQLLDNQRKWRSICDD